MADQRYTVQALATGLEILNVLRRHPHSTLGEVAEHAGLGTSQAFRLLHTLEEAGFVHKSSSKTYRLDMHCLTLGYAAHRDDPLIAQSRDVLDHLVEKTSESSHLVVRHGLVRVIADIRDSPRRVRSSAPLGQISPLYSGGTGPTILAFSPPELVEQVLSAPLKAATPKTVIDVEKIRKTLAEIRQKGYHVAREDFMLGAFSVAAPIFDAHGQCNTSICVAGPISRLTESSQPKLVEEVIGAATVISRRLGH
jgi:IclR family KDG regulon transcriptional repressor